MKVIYKKDSTIGYIVDDSHVEALLNDCYVSLPNTSISDVRVLSEAKIQHVLNKVIEPEPELEPEPEPIKPVKKVTKKKSGTKKKPSKEKK